VRDDHDYSEPATQVDEKSMMYCLRGSPSADGDSMRVNGGEVDYE
jgi:hypothetical protein